MFAQHRDYVVGVIDDTIRLASIRTAMSTMVDGDETPTRHERGKKRRKIATVSQYSMQKYDRRAAVGRDESVRAAVANLEDAGFDHGPSL
jgi:hypothetical protein